MKLYSLYLQSRTIAVAILMMMKLTAAGSNQNAELFVDMNPQTPQNDSLATGAFGTPILIGIRVANAKYLDTYGFHLGFDSSLVSFVKANPAMPESGSIDFLETRGGASVGFFGKISILDSTQVAVGNGLVGRDSAKTPSGSGLLVVMEFKVKGPILGQASFSLSEVKLLDWQQSLDTDIAVHSGAISIRPSAAILRVTRSNPPAMRLQAIAIALARSRSKSGFYLLGRNRN